MWRWGLLRDTWCMSWHAEITWWCAGCCCLKCHYNEYHSPDYNVDNDAEDNNHNVVWIEYFTVGLLQPIPYYWIMSLSLNQLNRYCYRISSSTQPPTAFPSTLPCLPAQLQCISLGESVTSREFAKKHSVELAWGLATFVGELFFVVERLTPIALQWSSYIWHQKRM